MTAIELKTEIDKELDTLSEKTLEDVLKFIKEKQFKEKLHANFDTFVNENEGLLRRLAE